MERIIDNEVRPGCTPQELQAFIHKETGTKLCITNVRKIMHRHSLSPKAPRKIHVNRANKKAVQN